MKRYHGRLLLTLQIIIIIVYIIWDHHRIIIASQEIEIEDLPDEVNGLRILQITDLHERVFGEDQKRLLKIINALSYDVLVFTGDMMNAPESTNYQSFFTLLEGIHNKDHIIYIPGNTDPPNYDVSPSFEKSDYIGELEKRGATLLESIYTVEKEGKSVHFVNFELAIIKNPEEIGNINGSFKTFHASDDDYQAYQKKLWEEMRTHRALFHRNDPIIALNHYPVPDLRIDYIDTDPNTVWHDFDLIIAGHYHGGQIRIPLYGALFIPDPWYEPTSFFPPRDRVKGLWEYKQTKQYVSTGLGSSNAISFLNFRLFNPPEINLLILK